ncbi:hypothetical protein LO763_20135 [Glycomyces sp. A-F 0318]|uniref:hypothetical protein n=1 Tax=Glycomyces amatae TaxID=2881355 RepID=UPI001E5CB972|nr:hypothetical protein [Glycomyces amatae]MCD0445924.1 hypothetical protein [Glycomyces amatae]
MPVEPNDDERFRIRVQRTVANYSDAITPALAAALHRLVQAGDHERAIAGLAETLVREHVHLQYTDAVEFRSLLNTAASHTPSHLRDLLLFNRPPDDGHVCYLPDGPAPAVAAAAMAAEFTVPPAAIATGVGDEYTGPKQPLVYLADTAGRPRVTVWAADEFFASRPGTTALTVATALCARLGCRALLDTYGMNPVEWMLVTPEGGRGMISELHEDELAPGQDWGVDLAYEPILGAPELRVVEDLPWWG